MPEVNFKLMRNMCFVVVEHKQKKSRGRKSFIKSLQDLRKLAVLFYNETMPANSHIALLQAYQKQQQEEIICHGGGYYKTNLDGENMPKIGTVNKAVLEFYGASDTVGKFDAEVLQTIIDRERVGYEPLSQFAVIKIDGMPYLNTFKFKGEQPVLRDTARRPIVKATYTPPVIFRKGHQ